EAAGGDDGPGTACDGAGCDPWQAGAKCRQKRDDREHDQDLAQLHADVETQERPRERSVRQSELAEHAGEAESVDEPERERDSRAPVAAARTRAKILEADVDDAERDQGLDDAPRDPDHAQDGERERDAVRQREGRGYLYDALQGSPEQQQPDDEEDVIGTDEDMVDPGADERGENRRDSFRTLGIDIHAWSLGGQDLLRRDPAARVVDIQECLVLTVLGEEPRLDAQLCRRR